MEAVEGRNSKVEGRVDGDDAETRGRGDAERVSFRGAKGDTASWKPAVQSRWREISGITVENERQMSAKERRGGGWDSKIEGVGRAGNSPGVEGGCGRTGRQECLPHRPLGADFSLGTDSCDLPPAGDRAYGAVAADEGTDGDVRDADGGQNPGGRNPGETAGEP